MKKHLLVIIALILLSPSAFSITGKDRWSEIRKSRDVLIQQPAFAKVFGPHGLFNACATEDEFKSITPVKDCEDCYHNEARHVTISRTFTRYYERGSVVSTYPSSFYLPVIEGSGTSAGDLLFSKKYSLPTCE